MELDDLSANLSEANISDLGRRDALGADLNFEESLEKLRLAREIVEGFRSNIRYASIQSIERVTEALRSIATVIGAMRAFTPAETNPVQTRDGLIATLDRALDDLRQWGVPVMAAASASEVAAAAAQAQTYVRTAEDAVQTAEVAANKTTELFAEAQKAGAGLTASTTSDLYKRQADGHRLKSWAAGIGAAVAAIAIVPLAIGWPPELGSLSNVNLSADDAWIRVLIAIAPRAVLVGLLFYGLRFAVRYFQVNSHLQVLNENRRNGLDTVPLLTKSTSDPAVADALLAQIVKALFTDATTGFLKEEKLPSITIPGVSIKSDD